MRKAPRREGKGGKGLPRGTAGFGSSPLKPRSPGGEYKIPGAKGYAVGGKSLFSPAALVIAFLAGGGAVASAVLLKFHVVGPEGARWVLYGGVILAGIVFLWEGWRRLSDNPKKGKSRRPPGR